MKSLSMAPLWFVLLLVENANPTTTSNVDAKRKLAMNEKEISCPSCDTIFSMVHLSAEGKRVQDIEMQERGEPKSGTGFMFSWARKTLDGTCEYLRRTYGRNTCHSGRSDDQPAMNHTLTFEPGLGGDDAKCSCKNIDRVRINVSQHHKHRLPVNADCRWYHPGGFPQTGSGCKTVAGRRVNSYADVAACVQEARCRINGICQWVAMRYIVFERILNDRSTIFWYDEAREDPVGWHNRLLASVGVRLPASEVSVMADAATRRVKLNSHPGGASAVANRTWKDEVDLLLWDEIDYITRTWLPPQILSHIGL